MVIFTCQVKALEKGKNMENFGRYINTATDETATLIHDGVTKTLRSDSGKEMTLAPAIFKKWWKPVDGEPQEIAEEPKQEVVEAEPVEEPTEQAEPKDNLEYVPLDTLVSGNSYEELRKKYAKRFNRNDNIRADILKSLSKLNLF